MNPLNQIRAAIDQVDQELVLLLNRRAELAQEIGQLKAKSGEPVYSPSREEEVIRRAIDSNAGPLSAGAVRAILREVISGCRSLQHTCRVAYLGPEFSYSHLAAIHQFGQSAELLPVATIAAAFEEVERGHAEFALVPMENSTDGRVSDCSITSSSGSSALDNATCNIIRRRARYTPAKDQAGNPITGTDSARIRWELPED